MDILAATPGDVAFATTFSKSFFSMTETFTNQAQMNKNLAINTKADTRQLAEAVDEDPTPMDVCPPHQHRPPLSPANAMNTAPQTKTTMAPYPVPVGQKAPTGFQNKRLTQAGISKYFSSLKRPQSTEENNSTEQTNALETSDEGNKRRRLQ